MGFAFKRFRGAWGEGGAIRAIRVIPAIPAIPAIRTSAKAKALEALEAPPQCPILASQGSLLHGVRIERHKLFSTQISMFIQSWRLDARLEETGHLEFRD